MRRDTLYWSVRGEVACGEHAPSAVDPRWAVDRWKPVGYVRRDGRYQCQHCHRTPVRHVRRGAPARAPEDAGEPTFAPPRL